MRLQKELNPTNYEDNNRPLGDYFNSEKKYIIKLLNSDFSERISLSELDLMRETIIKQGMSYSPKFATYLKDRVKKLLYLCR